MKNLFSFDLETTGTDPVNDRIVQIAFKILSPDTLEPFRKLENRKTGAMKKNAIISDCKQYRYRLERTWDESKAKALFIMLNPSTADATDDDPTIRRCIGFAKQWGYGGLLVGNLYAYRATKPKELLTVKNPIGDENIEHLQKMFREAELIVCAWGNANIVDALSKKYEYKPLRTTVITELTYLELAKDGTPKHPLYLKGELSPKRYDIRLKRLKRYN